MNQQQHIEFLLKFKKNAELKEYKDLKMVMYQADIRGELKPAVSAFKGKQKNPFSNYYYLTIESASKAIKNFMEAADKRQEYKEQKAAERKAFKPEFEVGDIFATSWGYEQTNVEFYQVIEKPSAHYAVIQEIAQEVAEGSTMSHGMACDVLPVKDNFLNDKTERRKVGKHGISFSSYRSAWKWDGKPQYKSWYY